ncbi:O-phosphoseryl-tRNA(Sec) selenium transferase [Diplonema papillatum]|nr:O-phosphoseryl-tRNA(Sec) selenium transferase [Diplonema papillatum]
MNEAAFEHARGIVNKAYIDNAQHALRRVEALVQSLLAQRRLPEEGWSDDVIELVLHHCALMDSNNYVGNVGVGEREGRVHSAIVRRRHYGMAHGIGRSGDLTANQPKAAGSSLIYSLTNLMAADVLRMAGVKLTHSAVVVPTATGMALSLVLSSLPSHPPSVPSHSPTAPLLRKRWVIWSRIDQKTCLKCIYSAGFEAYVVPLKRTGDFFTTDLDGIAAALMTCTPENVLCVLTTTSCFAPRLPDNVLEVARLCKKYEVPHVINNAYGVQSSGVMKQINAAIEHGRVDFFVQSSDKNFMVPVGASVVASPKAEIMQKMCGTYAGRASGSGVMDLFVTFLSIGRKGYADLLAKRVALLPYFHAQIRDFAASVGERLIEHRSNDISFCMTVDSFPGISTLGSALFNHCVSGPRTVRLGDRKTVCGIEFANYGSHSDETNFSYLTLACAIGIEGSDIDVFLKRLKAEWAKMLKRSKKKAATTTPSDYSKLIMEETPPT